MKNLGIKVSSNLKWTEHLNMIKTKAFARCQHILRSFYSKNLWTLLKAFTVYVRPLVECSSIIWNPTQIQDIKSIESVQRYYTRQIFRRCKLSYQSYLDRLYQLNIKTLEYRRVEIDIITIYKILHSLIDLKFSEFFEMYNSPYNTRRHRYSIVVKRCASKAQQSFFANRVVPVWNRLPASLVEVKSLAEFRTKLKTFDLTAVATLVYV